MTDALGGDDGWLVVVDPQAVFADPATSPWGSPMWAATVPRIAELAASFGRARTVVTRFVADPALGGSWGPYYRDWPFALVPGTDPLYAVVPELADVADHVVTAGTFGKWPVLRELLGADAHLTLTGVADRLLRALDGAARGGCRGHGAGRARRVRGVEPGEPRAGPGRDGPLRPPDHHHLTPLPDLLRISHRYQGASLLPKGGKSASQDRSAGGGWCSHRRPAPRRRRRPWRRAPPRCRPRPVHRRPRSPHPSPRCGCRAPPAARWPRRRRRPGAPRRSRRPC